MRINNYRIIKKIGEGGMAEIYLAIHESFSKKVAIKIIKDEISSDTEIVKRFKREARLIAKLNNSNIVQIYDDGIFNRRYYIILEYMSNGNLRDYIKYKRLSIKDIIKLLIPVVDALYFVHSKGIIHRDLKPSNILLDDNFMPKLSDFGISSFSWGGGERLTTTNTAIGTIEYMSPEQKTDAKHVDFRTDIYSMGVILYELFTGKIPMGNFEPPIVINPELSVDLNDIIMKTLNQDKMKRFPSMKILSEKLRQILPELKISESKPISAEESLTVKEERKMPEDPFLIYLNKLKRGITITDKIEIKKKLKDNVRDEHFEIIKNNLETANGVLKEALLLSLGNIRTDDSFEILKRYMTDPYYRDFAIMGLCYQNTEDAKKEVAKILKLPCKKIYKILDYLLLIKIQGLKEKIIECLNSENKEVRRTAVNIFSKIAEKRDEKHLSLLIRKENDYEIKTKAKTILEALKIQ
jgi:serine/threonine protein kinase